MRVSHTSEGLDFLSKVKAEMTITVHLSSTGSKTEEALPLRLEIRYQNTVARILVNIFGDFFWSMKLTVKCGKYVLQISNPHEDKISLEIARLQARHHS